MKKEEILIASKKDNEKKDEFEIAIDIKAIRIGTLCAFILTTIYYCYEIFIGKGSNPTLYSIITSFCAGVYIYKGIKIDKNRKLNLFAGIVWLILTIMIVTSYFIGE